MSVRFVRALQGPLQAPLSSPLGSLTSDVALMIRRTNGTSHLNQCKSGGSLVPGTREGNPMVVPNLNFPPSRLGLASSINDKYCICPINQTPYLMLDNYHQESQVHVSCLNVVTPVHFAALEELLQKKGVRPEICKTKIKYVIGVSFVNHCLSAPPVINVQQCCKRKCGRLAAKILASLAVLVFKSEGCLYLARGIPATLQDETTTDMVTSEYQWICKFPPEPRPKRGFVFPYRKTGSRKSHGSVFHGLLQKVVLGFQM